MSYILEALKKAEKERRKESVPTLQTNHAPLTERGKKVGTPPHTTLLIGAAILITILAVPSFLYLTGKKLPEPASQVPAAVPSPPAETATSAPMPQPEPNPVPTSMTAQRPQPLQEKQSSQVPEVRLPPGQPVTLEPRPLIAVDETPVITAPESAQPPGHTNTPQLPTLEELPPQIREQIPPLELAGHTYSDIPGQRMIIVNSRIIREGHHLGDGLKLEEITWDGLILSKDGIRFAIGASQ